jgi:hypothetical protein
VIRDAGIQVVAIGPPLFGHTEFLERAAAGDDPLAGRRLGRALAHLGHDIRNRADVGEQIAHVHEMGVGGIAGQVQVGVGQPGQGSPALQVNGARVAAGQLANFGIRAGGQDPAVLNGDGFGSCSGLVHGEDLAVFEDHVGV